MLRKLIFTTTAIIATAVTAAFAADAAQPSALSSMFPLLVIFVIFYFFLIRPQQKQAKKHQQMLNAIKKDDKIVTNGGIYGTVTSVKGGIIEVKIAEGVKVQLSKSAVSSLVTDESDQVVTPEIVKH